MEEREKFSNKQQTKKTKLTAHNIIRGMSIKNGICGKRLFHQHGTDHVCDGTAAPSNFDNDEEAVLKYLIKLSGEDVAWGIAGVCCSNSSGREAIGALINCYEKTIDGVPVNCRESCRKQLINSIRLPTISYRRNLLCTIGQPGSGKSTVLNFNLKWFIEETQGIAIAVSFSDDQAWLLKCRDDKINRIQNEHDLELALAVRILHRVVQNLQCDNDAIIQHFLPNSVLVKMVNELRTPFKSAIYIIKRLLGASDNINVLLAIDELENAVDGSSNLVSCGEMLTYLTSKYLDNDPSLHLSLTIKKAENLFTMRSRTKFFQFLTPICTIAEMNQKQIHLLPLLLQPFYDVTIRCLLSCTQKTLQYYAMVSRWLWMTGGLATRIKNLYSILRDFDKNVKKNEGFSWSDFVSNLHSWLNVEIVNRIEIAITRNAPYSDNFHLLVDCAGICSETELTDAVESLALDCACPFNMPAYKETAFYHRSTLNGLVHGHCTILGRVDNQVVTYIPLCILDRLSLDISKLKPCGAALMQLGETIKSLEVNYKQEKKTEWMDIISAAILLYVRANRKFSLQSFCTTAVMCGTDMSILLRGGPSVQYQTLPNRFLANGVVTHSELLERIEYLNENSSPGCLFMSADDPTSTLNKEVYGFFKIFNRPNEYVLMVISQCSAMASSASISIEDRWRLHRNSGFPQSIVEFDCHKVYVLHMLASFNDDVVQSISCEKNEGVLTSKSMCVWLPTAGYACDIINTTVAIE